MGSVEDLRKVIQDLVAPDLKSLNVRLDSSKSEIDLRFKSAETLAARRHETVLNTIAASTSHIMNALSLDKQGSHLESRQAAGVDQHA